MSFQKALQERLVERKVNVVCWRSCIKFKKFIKINKEDEKDCIKFEEFIKINKKDEEDDWIKLIASSRVLEFKSSTWLKKY